MTISFAWIWGGMGGCGSALDRLQPPTLQRVRAAGKETCLHRPLTGDPLTCRLSEMHRPPSLLFHGARGILA